MAANCKNTTSLPVLCWQGNWTPGIDQKKAPAAFSQTARAPAGPVYSHAALWRKGEGRAGPAPFHLGSVVLSAEMAAWVS